MEFNHPPSFILCFSSLILFSYYSWLYLFHCSCDVCLMYPPYMIALACIHMAAVVTKKDVKAWFSELSVDMEKILEITTNILDLYKLWKKYDEAKEVPELLERVPKPKFDKSPSPTEALKAKSTPSPKK